MKMRFLAKIVLLGVLLIGAAPVIASEANHNQDVKEAVLLDPEIVIPAVRRLGTEKWIDDLQYVWFKNTNGTVRTLAAIYLARIESMRGILKTLQSQALRFEPREAADRKRELEVASEWVKAGKNPEDFR